MEYVVLIVAWVWTVPPLVGLVYVVMRVSGIVKYADSILDAIASALAIQIPLQYFFNTMIYGFVCWFQPIVLYLVEHPNPGYAQHFAACVPAPLDAGSGVVLGVFQNIMLVNLQLLLLPTIFWTIVFCVLFKSSRKSVYIQR